MRCTAANITAADAMVVKKSQFTRKACQARDSPVAAPTAKSSMPSTPTTNPPFLRAAGIVLACRTPTNWSRGGE
jgi:hypothetical protein